MLLHSSASVVVDNGSLIRDAEIGIDASAGALVDLTDSDFEANEISVYLHNGNFSNAIIQGCVIDGLNSPNPSFAVVIEDANGVVSVGNAGASANMITNHEYGISISNSDVTVANTDFDNILKRCWNGGAVDGCGTFEGSAIISSSNASHSLIVGSNSIGDQCIFSDCTYGVTSMFQTQLHVELCEFTNANYTSVNEGFGVMVIDRSGGNPVTRTIANNIFNHLHFGVQISNAILSDVTVSGNFFNTGVTNPSHRGLTAITMRNTFMNEGGERDISFNTITHFNRGISISNQNTVDQVNPGFITVTENNIGFDDNPDGWWGIRLSYCNSADVIGNSIIGSGPAPQNIARELFGIMVDNYSDLNLISDNLVQDLGAGIRIFNCHQMNTISCNEFVENIEQALTEDATPGNQGAVNDASDNTWTMSAYTTGNIQHRGGPLNPTPRWFVVNGGSTDPDDPSYSCGGGPPCINPPFAAVLDYTISANQCPPRPTDPAILQDYLARIYLDTAGFDSLLVEQKYMLKKFAFYSISKDTSLLNLSAPFDTLLQLFYDEYDSSNIALFYHVESFIAEDDMTSAMTILNSITPQNEIEAALDDALRIYIDSWAKGDYFVSTSDSSYLMDLAGRNPRYYGSAVEIARVMMNTDQVDYYDTASARMSRPLTESEAVKTMTEPIDLFDVIPNPNTGKMIFRCKAGVAKGMLRIFDGIGNVISRYAVSAEDTDVELFSARPGMYFYFFTGADQAVARGKFVIQR